MDNSLNQTKARVLDKYFALIRPFVSGDVDVASFEKEYLEAFKSEETLFGEPIYEILNELFGDIDEYCADPTIRDDDDIDEQELLKRATDALDRLESL